MKRYRLFLPMLVIFFVLFVVGLMVGVVGLMAGRRSCETLQERAGNIEATEDTAR